MKKGNRSRKCASEKIKNPRRFPREVSDRSILFGGYVPSEEELEEYRERVRIYKQKSSKQLLTARMRILKLRAKAVLANSLAEPLQSENKPAYARSRVRHAIALLREVDDRFVDSDVSRGDELIQHLSPSKIKQFVDGLVTLMNRQQPVRSGNNAGSKDEPPKRD